MRKGTDTSGTTPTVVLVHGAFADASRRNGVIKRLQAKGSRVAAPASPLRGIASDTAYIAAVIEQIDGPVVAVGHSYAGAAITNAAVEARNVVGLVFVAAFAPEEGERLGEAAAASKDAVLGSVQVARKYPAGDGKPAVEFVIDPAGFRDAFAADLPAELTAVMATTQQPVSELAFSEPSGPLAW
jgi:pimeloyl-ACP methyl ester carboxylesterase